MGLPVAPARCGHHGKGGGWKEFGWCRRGECQRLPCGAACFEWKRDRLDGRSVGLHYHETGLRLGAPFRAGSRTLTDSTSDMNPPEATNVMPNSTPGETGPCRCAIHRAVSSQRRAGSLRNGRRSSRWRRNSWDGDLNCSLDPYLAVAISHSLTDRQAPTARKSPVTEAAVEDDAASATACSHGVSAATRTADLSERPMCNPTMRPSRNVRPTATNTTAPFVHHRAMSDREDASEAEMVLEQNQTECHEEGPPRWHAPRVTGGATGRRPRHVVHRFGPVAKEAGRASAR